MIKIDLSLLEKFGVNINEYFTLYKIFMLQKNEDIPYVSHSSDLKNLISRDFLIDQDGMIYLTDKSKKLLNNKEDAITEIIKYFKEITGKKKVSETSPSNRKFIRDRLQQGYTIEDLKAVIKVMNTAWKDSSMKEYIRIETLFNETKFQKYINKVESERKEDSINVGNFKRI